MERSAAEATIKKVDVERAAAAASTQDKLLGTRLKKRPRLRGCHGPSLHHSRPSLQAACPSHLTSPISAAEVNSLLVKTLHGKSSITAIPLTDVTTLGSLAA